jgi:hypothetical protein
MGLALAPPHPCPVSPHLPLPCCSVQRMPRTGPRHHWQPPPEEADVRAGWGRGAGGAGHEHPPCRGRGADRRHGGPVLPVVRVRASVHSRILDWGPLSMTARAVVVVVVGGLSEDVVARQPTAWGRNWRADRNAPCTEWLGVVVCVVVLGDHCPKRNDHAACLIRQVR